MQTTAELIIKATKVVDSCITMEQAQSAYHYLKLVREQISTWAWNALDALHYDLQENMAARYPDYAEQLREAR